VFEVLFVCLLLILYPLDFFGKAKCIAAAFSSMTEVLLLQVNLYGQMPFLIN